MIDELKAAVKARQVILFVGAGVSMNLGLPSWGQLIAEMATQLGYDPDVLGSRGDFLALAEFYLLKKSTIGDLRSWMDRKWHIDEPKVDNSAIHKAILNLNAPLIYTTNYDRWLEIAHERSNRNFLKVANVGDIAKIRDGVTQIVKFHGDFADDNSLVLGETSYFERLSFESPLDIKFRADSLGKTLLFIGYSLSDINIRLLLYKLHKIWVDSAHSATRPKSYIFLGRPNHVQETILAARGILPIVSPVENPGDGLAQFLESLAPA